MLMQEKMSGPDTLFKLYVATDEDLNVLQSQLRTQQLPVDQRGGLSATQCRRSAHDTDVGRVAGAEG
jgi:hypothetical protein